MQYIENIEQVVTSFLHIAMFKVNINIYNFLNQKEKRK